MISAIISGYYAKDFLQERIENLQAQKDCTIVVVAQEFSPEHEISVKMHVDKLILTYDIPSVYTAWNLGIRACTTRYVTNANSDDILYPDALAYLVDLLERNKDYALVYGNSDVVYSYGGLPQNRYEWGEGGITELLLKCFIGPMPVWRRNLHEKYGFFDEGMLSAGDYEMWLRLAAAGEKFLHTKRCVGAFFSHKASASMRQPLRSTWETARARSRYLNSFKEI